MKQEVADLIINTEFFIYLFKIGIGIKGGDLLRLNSPCQKLPDKNAFPCSKV
ncbi:hypothetical protein ES703_71798 [subsurface metagenome]